MISRMRVLSAHRTIACADKVMHITLETYSAPNKTIPELSDLIRGGTGIDPLKDFGEVRDELRTRY